MKHRRLGRTDIEVSVIAMGCWAIADPHNWGPQDEQDTHDAVNAALDAGVTLFDTAEGYGGGLSERMLGKALGKRRDQAVIASKVSAAHLKPNDLRQACERSLMNLGTDVIDLYQIHWPNWDLPLEPTLRELEALRTEGKIRAIGVSNFGVRDLTDTLAIAHVESNQLAYSLLVRALEDEIQPICVREDVSILCYSPIAQGLLTGKFLSPDDVPDARARTRHFAGTRPQARHGEPGCEVQTFAAIDELRLLAAELEEPMGAVALAWLLARPAVASVLTGIRNAEQARANAHAAELTLEPALLARLDRATEPVKQAMGPLPDPWAPPDQPRMR